MQNIFRKYLDNQCSPEEVKALLVYFNSPENEDLLRNCIRECMDDNTLNAEEENQWKHAAVHTYAAIKKQIAGEEVRVIPITSKWWFKVAAAAIVIVMLGGGYFYFFNKAGHKNDIVKNITPSKDIAAPSSTKASITLSNGQTVSLDSITAGTLAQQDNVNVTKTADGQIIYTGATSETAYNTLTNPRGSTVVNLTLSDGTKVWLNSESSLTYPVAFAGNERKVIITGEAYFEVAKDARKHFFVDARGVITEVLGTHFNVNSYGDEANTKITLLEGSVKVTKGNLNSLLKPGQQASVDANIKVADGVDADEVMAWKNEKFIFKNADLKSIMRQLERWYDVETAYQIPATSEEFIGVISRNVRIAEILKMLETTGAVKFEIEGRKIIVK
jgi:hypothetical protein